MKPWKEFKRHNRQISTDSVSIDEKLYHEIQQDAHYGNVDIAQQIQRLHKIIHNQQVELKKLKKG
jgi:hypothetical protein